MNPDHQRNVITEFCGITIDRNSKEPWFGYSDKPFLGSWKTSLGHEPTRYYGRVPDYLNNLNAMAEAEKRLDSGQRLAYDRELSRHFHYAWEATAAQRAEALIRCIGRWEDE